MPPAINQFECWTKGKRRVREPRDGRAKRAPAAPAVCQLAREGNSVRVCLMIV